jgi:DNA-directed RNA polymerase subunit RPC12/RpoP
MSHKCLECDHIFELCEAKKVKEDYGYEYRCSICGGNFEETVKCSVCKGEFLEEELNGGVCDECINEYRNDFNRCYQISCGEVEKVEINALLATLFEVAEINQILIEYVLEKMPNVNCSQFIDSDISWFGEKISEEVKKNENRKV